MSIGAYDCEAWWFIGRYVEFRPKGRAWGSYISRSGRHVGTLGQSFTRNCLWRFPASAWNSDTV